MISRETIDRIMQTANIVEVISEFMTLRRSGSGYKGLCPFHNEKTPSFTVSPARGTFHCFGCGKHGTVVGFIMEHEQMTYPEALQWLANRYHIPIEEHELTDEERREASERESIYVVSEWAARWMHRQLLESEDGCAIGMTYFRSRAVRDDMIERFMLGYSPASRTALCSAARAAGFDEKYLVASGLCVQRDDGSLYDRFAGRVMFPWMSISGKVIGFGGRVLDSRTKGVSQKYVNTPTTPIYHKDRELYGLFQAKQSIVREKTVYMVEGYTDVISMHQSGLGNVVANSGTALSPIQANLLHRFSSQIVLLYDGDSAGIHAALRSADILLQEGMNIKVLLLPDGDDPDSFARKHTADEMKVYIEAHQVDFIRFKANLLSQESQNDPIKRANLIRDMVVSIAQIPDPITRTVYIQECSRLMQVSEQMLTTEVATTRRTRRRTPQVVATPTANNAPAAESNPSAPRQAQPGEAQSHTARQETPLEAKERLLAQVVVRQGGQRIDGKPLDAQPTDSPTVAEYIKNSLAADGLEFSDAIYRRIIDEAYRHGRDEGFESERYFLTHPDAELCRVATDLAGHTYRLSDIYKDDKALKRMESLDLLVPHLVQEFRLAYIQQRLVEVQTQLNALRNEPDSQKLMELMRTMRDLKTIERSLAEAIGERVVM